ncbi:hypothetical protein GQ44DRAFT_698439 [Phaeosphaeriaceae sp. PMI808]|nr:hypothetical protein GQ44DRAFT_698439 [Phaeosphaeriaceae sp. PMI808]
MNTYMPPARGVWSVTDACSHYSNYSSFSNEGSINDWLATVYGACSQSEKGPTASQQLSRDAQHTSTIPQSTKSTAGKCNKAMRRTERLHARVTRSRSRQEHVTDEMVSVEMHVAALRMAEGDGNRQGIEAQDMHSKHNMQEENSHPDLVHLPITASAHHWMSADTQSQRSQSSWSTRTPADTETETVATKTTATSNPSKPKSRSKSPVKSMVDLSLLDRKVKRIHLSGDEFPVTIRQLVRDIESIRRGKGMIPYEIRSDFAQRTEVEDWWWSQTPSALPSQGKILVELDVMEEIRDKTRKLHDSDAAEPRWNSDVHFMMLRQVCMHLPGITQQNITSARPNSRLVPKTGFNDTESKLVDYALLCDETLIPPHLVEQVLADHHNGVDSINHTSASVQSLRRDPIAVSIETKTPNGSESVALTQLSLWAATHFNRLRTLLPPNKRDIILMPLPLVMAVGGRYSLFFAIDGTVAEGIAIAGGESAFGDCAMLEGCYQVLAGLRMVGAWVKEVWVPWFLKECLGA